MSTETRITNLMVPVERLCEEPFASIICYPKPSTMELRRRLKELRRLGVKALEFSGSKQVLNMPVLGKGCVGIVAIAHLSGFKAAIKIRRVDADRLRMNHEAEMLRTANAVEVGPKLLAVSKNFLLMEFVEGSLIPEWVEKCRSKRLLKNFLRAVLEQCRRLDEAGLDHGELSHAPKHIIIDASGKPFIVDFETASLNRKPSNVTAIAQYLFISGVVAEKIAAKLGERNRKALIEALRGYKTVRNRGNFEKILEVCGLQAT